MANHPLQSYTGTILSADGLSIGYTKFASLLAPTNTVYVYDRRGRDQSPDNEHLFSYQYEVDDLTTMVQLAGPDVSIIGHSYGGGITSSYILHQVSQVGLYFMNP